MKIEKITISINDDQTIDLTLDEAKSLKAALEELLGKTKEYVPYVRDWVYRGGTVSPPYPYITWYTTNDNGLTYSASVNLSSPTAD